ncbi:hypothetical protein OSB04_021672 [Centaurea solstitialis]|uniref:Peroxin 22 n=1 Tax=Centaurea solstitialis TaxID=347529 RepID=A0AA38SW90_9ASTR|nr:hypothetical protein OSB04_021672 [Centaurea solstitialis]
MADYSKNDLLNLIKRIGAYLSTKISKILNIQDFRSFWAIAGLAVAVIFTWRALRTPNGSGRRQPKRRPPTPRTSGFDSHPNEDVLPSAVGSSSKDSRAQSAMDEFVQPANLTLGQIVRHKLSDGRKVTCRLLGVILEESTAEELQQNQATVRSSVLEILSEITKYSDLYLMETVLDDESEKKVLTALENAGIFSGGLVKDKVLFCSTEIGRMSFVRQLEPDWHIDSNPEITSQLARYPRPH